MDIRPILTAMWRNRTGSVLVALQIAITLAIVVNSLFLAQERIAFINRATGMDVENIVVASSLGFGQQYQHDDTIESDLRLLQGIPGVVTATPTGNVPMGGSGNTTSYRGSENPDAPQIHANVFEFDEKAIATLGVKLSAGRNFTELEIRRTDSEGYEDLPAQVIITQGLADRLFDNGAALGQRLYSHLGQSAEVVGIVEHMYGSWVGTSEPSQLLWLPRRPDGPRVSYMIRTEPGMRDQLVPEIEKKLAEANRTRIVRNVRPMVDVVARSYENDRAIAVILVIAIALLMAVTGLGIVGLASFTVRQRTKQIGTRRAVGARKRDIIRYFLTENWLMTTIGIVLGTALSIGLNYWLSTSFEMERLNYLYLPLGMAMIWGLGLLAVAAPAKRAAQISPAIATRTV